MELLDGKLVVLLLEDCLLYLVLEYLSPYLVKLGRHRIHFGTYKRTSLVHKVDSLVGQEPVGDVSVGEDSGRDERLVLYLYAVEHLVSLFEPTQDRDSVLHCRLVHHYRLETPFQRSVLFDVLAVLVERRRTDAVQLAPCKHRLEQVACVHRTVGLACTDDVVKLVYEQDYPPLGLLYLLNDSLETLLELASVLCACDERTHIETENLSVLEVVRDISADDTLCKPLGYRSLADARLTDKAGVVLGLS